MDVFYEEIKKGFLEEAPPAMGLKVERGSHP